MKDKRDKRASKTKKSRPVTSKTGDPFLIIVRLENSILDSLRDIDRYTADSIKNRTDNKENYVLEKEIKEAKVTFDSLDKEIDTAEKYLDFPKVIHLLEEKNKIAKELSIKIHPHITTSDNPENEAQPVVTIDDELFIATHNGIVDTLLALRAEYSLMKKNAVKDSPISNKMLDILAEELKHLKNDVLKDFHKVSKELRSNKKSFSNMVRDTDIGTALLSTVKELFDITKIERGDTKKTNINPDQYAVVMNAQNKLALFVQSFDTTIKSFDEKIRYEKEIKLTKERAAAIGSVSRQLVSLRNKYSNIPLLQELDELLFNEDGSYKITFDENRFPVGANIPLASKEELNAKVQEVNSAYQSMVMLVKKHQNSLEPLIKDINYLTERRKVFSMLSHSEPLNFSALLDAINNKLDHITKADATFVAHLITNDSMKDQVRLQKDAVAQATDAFINRFPEITYIEERKTIVIAGKEYPRPLQGPIDFDYSEERSKILHALKKGDQSQEDYIAIYNRLLTAQKAIEAYAKSQDIVILQTEQIKTLINSIKMKLDTKPVSETDKPFHDQYSQISIKLNKLKWNLNEDSNKLIEDYQQKFSQLSSLQDSFNAQLNKINEVSEIFNKIVSGLEQEQERLTTKYGVNEPRLALLNDMSASIKSKIGDLNKLKVQLENIAHDENDLASKKASLKDISNTINIKESQACTDIKSIITDEKLEQISLSKRNPFLVWITKLIRPLIEHFYKDKPERKAGFFISKSELALKSLRETTTSVKGKEQPEDNEHKELK